MTAGGEGTLQRISVTIRDFQREDYPAIVEIANLSYPEHPTTVEERRFEDETFDRRTYVWRRYVAMEPPTNAVVGEADYNHLPWAYDPARFRIWFAVHAKWRRRGIGSLLYEKVLADLRLHGATQLRTVTQETQSDSVGWLRRRGFQELHRSWESRLDARTFDMGAFHRYTDPASGIEIATLAEELAKNSECLKDLYEMHCELSLDEPRVDPFTRGPFVAGMGRE
jgi:ribosomal protein S18 acetylase RimI-like enzyme